VFACYLSATNPYQNLGVEEEIFAKIRKNCLNKFSQGGVLVWVNKPSVVVGKYQNICAEVNLPYIYDNDISLLRRISGGGCVYHDYGNLNYSFILPKKRGMFGDVVKYQQLIADVLRSLGLVVVVNKRGDILLNNNKISGCAQKICGDWVLHHGTLLFAADKFCLRQSLRLDARITVSDFATASVRSAVTNIVDELAGMARDEFYQYMFAQLQKGFSATKMELEQFVSKQKVKNRVANARSWDWLYKQNPTFNLQQKISLANKQKVEISFEVQSGRIVTCAFNEAENGLPLLEKQATTLLGANFELERIQKLLYQFGDKWGVAKQLTGCQIFRRMN